MSRVQGGTQDQPPALIERAERAVGSVERTIREWRPATRVTPIAVDLLLTFVVTIISLGPLIGMISGPQVRPSGAPPVGPPAFTVLPAFGLILLQTLPLMARRRWPLFVLAVTELAAVLYLVIWPIGGGLTGLGVAVALYTVASLSERHLSLLLAGLVTGINGLILLVDIVIGRSNSLLVLFTVMALVIGGWALGDNVGTRRAYLAELEERARHLALEQEARAERAVQVERARIARELHDVVAHHISAIAVQAGAGAAVAERDPRRTRDVLESIQETSREALAEMRAMLNVLRSDDEAPAERVPQPSLAQIERLVKQSLAVGLPVTLKVDGTPHALPEALDVSAYRIVQEALTNVLKHAGPAHAAVLIRYTPDAVELEIRDDGRGARGRPEGSNTSNGSNAAGPGRGLVGMRERVALFGGELVAGPAPDHGFTVRARLPVRSG